MRVLGTRLKERYWAKRHLRGGDDWGYGNDDWVRGYWDSRNHLHRSFLVERISKFFPSSILEIGCNCGPNLYLLAQKFPRAEIVGVDINPLAVQKGNEWFVREGISNVRLLVGKADERDGSYCSSSIDPSGMALLRIGWWGSTWPWSVLLRCVEKRLCDAIATVCKGRKDSDDQDH